jgi:DNA-binding beta-propeller fold protein YncE
VINAKTASVVNTIALGDNPEFAAAFSAADRIYCNVEDKSEVTVIDTAKHAVVARLAPSQLEWRSTRRITGCSSAVITN